MIANNSFTLITCILPFHQAHTLLERLEKEKGVITANKSSARGSSYTTDFKWIEMEVLEVIVPQEKADEIFAYLFFEAHINQQGGGIIFQNRLETASAYSLPNIEDFT